MAMYACRTISNWNSVRGLATMADNTKTTQHPSLIRRLLAVFYDALLLLALFFVTTAVMMSFNDGKAIQPGQTLFWLHKLILIIISFLFYGWFWTHGGQTLGMKSWKMQLTQDNGQTVTWPVALVRFGTAMLSWAAFGLGFMWSLFDSRSRTWHDIASGSALRDLRDDS
jgi:uncharacterized RDD family membrane protein YckC